ncbi:MAG TPA: diaminopimelate epimerase [Gammaproteobacteria bacterium]|nr:diaminopimelate epimerase [Gammaproteobacteria bacterium]
MRQTSPSTAPRPLAFHKMVGAGNDFVVVDARATAFVPDRALAQHIADRRDGIGCDQLLVIGPDTSGEAEFTYRIWNADGGEVGQCGNGARCLALLWATELAPAAREFSMRSATGLVQARVAAGHAEVSMGVPEFRPERIPLAATSEASRYTMTLGDRSLEFGAVSMGNPHAVIVLDEMGIDDVARAPVTELGPAVERHPDFPQRANVGFARVLRRDRIALRVWERGVGETLACGTGACAAAAILHDRGVVDARVTVELPGGSLGVEWHGRGSPAWLSGPSRKVFEGTITL